MTLEKIASAILNDLWGGNVIPTSNRSLISLEQIEDEVLAERQLLIRELYINNLLSDFDLAMSINCVEVDCKDKNKCTCRGLDGEKSQHFEIPQTVDGIGSAAISFIGSTDRSESFKIYYNPDTAVYQKYKKRGSEKPYVYIDKTPNENGFYDGWIFNAPFVKYITIVGIFKNPRDLEKYGCCNGTDFEEMGSLSADLIKRILAKKTNLYRQPSIPASQTTA